MREQSNNERLEHKQGRKDTTQEDDEGPLRSRKNERVEHLLNITVPNF